MAKKPKQQTITKLSRKLGQEWKGLVVGQDDAIDKMVPYINRFMAGIRTPDKPIANLFLLGPTGVGKTKSAEALAQVLHESDRKLIKINCGEFSAEHEIAKLIGSPPGYLGHRETVAVLNQKRLDAMTSEDCPLSIVLFDEIEKGSTSLFKLLLGIMDNATLRLGDNNVVNFENTLVIFTSNLGAKEISNMLAPRWGFDRSKLEVTEDTVKALERAGDGALKKLAAPEFVNRLDEILFFRPLTHDEILSITDLELCAIRTHLATSLPPTRVFTFTYTPAVVKFITEVGTDLKSGARSIKRAIARHIFNPLSDAYLDDEIQPGDDALLFVRDGKIEWKIQRKETEVVAA